MAGVEHNYLKITGMDDVELIKVSDEKHKYINTKYKKVSAKMYDYKCDVKLKVGKEAFKAHRDVLAEASDYFSAMFSHDMLEREQMVIELHEISPEGFTAMMDYFYHGHVTITPRNIEDIIEAARFFHIEWLVNVACDFLKRHLSLEDYQLVLLLDDKYYLGDLRESIFQFVSHRFMELSKEPKFMKLSYEVLHKLLQDDIYINAPEGFIFHTVLRWLRHDPEEREKYWVPLLQLIRYPLLEEQELAAIPEECLQVGEVRELAEEALEYHANPCRQCLLSSDQTEVRGSMDAVVLFSAVDDAFLVQYKLPGLNDFFSQPVDTSFMQSVFEFSSVVELGNFVFVAGGYDRETWCSSPAFYRFNPRNQTWDQLCSMNQPRVSFSLCAAKNGLYAVTGIDHILRDGRDQEVIVDTVEFYDPTENHWDFIPSLPLGCFSSGAIVVDEKLYVSGGISSDPEDNVPTSYLHVYTPGQRTWTPKAPMITERQGHCMTAHNNKLFVVGGYVSDEDRMSFDRCYEHEMYDIETDQWSTLTEIPRIFGSFLNTTVKVQGKFYIVSCEGSQSFLSEYDPESMIVRDGEICGEHVQKITRLRVAMPPELIGKRLLFEDTIEDVQQGENK